MPKPCCSACKGCSTSCKLEACVSCDCCKLNVVFLFQAVSRVTVANLAAAAVTVSVMAASEGKQYHRYPADVPYTSRMSAAMPTEEGTTAASTMARGILLQHIRQSMALCSSLYCRA
ncbi:Hypp7057 [Branchiostoma lanceolatum]|uniref:Hypp7057 protein n=1 Tax=Branchiostoma lanceolatum TaxID=7740 RepID=A0A8K0EBX1_BRALA|nr:Hypp7057 [Branchiostoma lanceolatum]